MSEPLSVSRYAIPAEDPATLAAAVAERYYDWDQWASRWVGTDSTLAQFGVEHGARVLPEQLSQVLGGASVADGRLVRYPDVVQVDADDPRVQLGFWHDELRFEAPPAVAERFRTGDTWERDAIRESLLHGAAEAVGHLTRENPVLERINAAGFSETEAADGFAAAAVVDTRGPVVAVRVALVGVEDQEGQISSARPAELSDAPALARAREHGRLALGRELAERGYAIDVALPASPEREPTVARPPYGARAIEREEVSVADPLDRYRRVLGDARAAELADSMEGWQEQWGGKPRDQLEARLAKLDHPFAKIDGGAFYTAQRVERDLANVDKMLEHGMDDPAYDDAFLYHEVDRLEGILDDLWARGAHPQQWMERERERAAEELVLRRELAVLRELEVMETVEQAIIWPQDYIVEALGPPPAKDAEHRGRWEALVDGIVRDVLANDEYSHLAAPQPLTPAEEHERDAAGAELFARVQRWRDDHDIDTPVSSTVWARGAELHTSVRSQEAGSVGAGL